MDELFKTNNTPMPAAGMGDARIMGSSLTEPIAPAMGQTPSETPFLTVIGPEQIQQWNIKLKEYKSGKTVLDNRIARAEKWWTLRNQFPESEVTDSGDWDYGFKAKSAWLFNTVASKHADYLESYPTSNILARAEDDKAEAWMLSKIIPVVMKQNHYQDTYDMNGWQKLKIGTGVYKVMWDKNRLNGMGDIAIVRRSLLNVYWEPGITNIQQSKLFFDVEMVDKETLVEEYPQLEDKTLSSPVEPVKMPTEDHKPSSDKVAVVEVYYKRKGKLHYCKYVGENVLYATENDNEPFKVDRGQSTGIIAAVHSAATDGLYDHGLYPYVFDVMFPMENSPAGFGYVDICANPQTRADELTQALLTNAMNGAAPRYFKRTDGGINEEEMLNLKKTFVHVNGTIDETELRPIETPALNGNHLAVLNNTVQEMRETSGNTEAGNGIAQSGVTAASAYAALQEASGKMSRAGILATYRAHEQVVFLVIELIRQFYALPRQFRITGNMGVEKYVTFQNSGMQPQWQGMVGGVDMGYRIPEYDIDIVPERKSSYTKIAQNEMAMELYGKGLFNPQMTDQALVCLEMMDFDSRDEIMQKVAKNGTMLQELRQWQQLALQLANRFAPDMVQGLSESVTGQPVAQIGEASGEGIKDAMTAGEGRESTMMENARERANTVAQPGGSTK